MCIACFHSTSPPARILRTLVLHIHCICSRTRPRSVINALYGAGWLRLMPLQWRTESFTTWSGKRHSSDSVAHAWQHTVLPHTGLAPHTFWKVAWLRAHRGYCRLSWLIVPSLPATDRYGFCKRRHITKAQLSHSWIFAPYVLMCCVWTADLSVLHVTHWGNALNA